MVNPKLKSRAPPPREGDPTGPRFAAEEETSQKGPRPSPAGGGRLGLAMERKLSPPVWSDRVAVGPVDRQLAGDHVAPVKLHLGDRDPIGPALAKLSHKYWQQQSISQAITNCYDWWGAVPSIGHSRYGGPCGVLDPGRPAQSPRRPCPGLRGIFPISSQEKSPAAFASGANGARDEVRHARDQVTTAGHDGTAAVLLCS